MMAQEQRPWHASQMVKSPAHLRMNDGAVTAQAATVTLEQLRELALQCRIAGL